MAKSNKIARIDVPRAEASARLNDQLRTTGAGGSMMITQQLRRVTGFDATVLAKALTEYSGFDTDVGTSADLQEVWFGMRLADVAGRNAVVWERHVVKCGRCQLHHRCLASAAACDPPHVIPHQAIESPVRPKPVVEICLSTQAESPERSRKASRLLLAPLLFIASSPGDSASTGGVDRWRQRQRPTVADVQSIGTDLALPSP